MKIQIELKDIVGLPELLSVDDSGEAYKKRVFSIIIREQTLSLGESHVNNALNISNSFNPILGNCRLDKEPLINWKHLIKSLICCDYHNPTIRKQIQTVLCRMEKVERLNELISGLGYLRLQDWRRRSALRRKRRKMLQQKVDFDVFVAMAIMVYEQKNLGTGMEFLQELCISYA